MQAPDQDCPSYVGCEVTGFGRMTAPAGCPFGGSAGAAAATWVRRALQEAPHTGHAPGPWPARVFFGDADLLFTRGVVRAAGSRRSLRWIARTAGRRSSRCRC